MNTLTTARIARDNAARHLSAVNPSIYGPGYGYRGTTTKIAEAKAALTTAQAVVDAEEAAQLEILKARAAKHVPGAIAPEDETTEDTLNRWAWIDLQNI